MLQTVRELVPGSFIGPYEVVEPLGSGRLETVFGVRSGGRLFALELILFDVSRATEAQRARFEQRAGREMKALGELDNPHLVRVLQLGWWRNGGEAFPYLLMERVAGLPWCEWIARGRATARRVVDALIPLSRALGQLHARELCHRELQIDSVLVRPEGAPVLTHPGIAQGQAAVALTVAEALSGECRHVSPEFAEFFLNGWRRGEHYSHLIASDLHVVGALLYVALTGRFPFRGEGDDVPRLMRRVLDGPPLHPCAIDPQAPRSLGELAMRLLSKKIRERPQGAEELSRELLRALEEAEPSWDVPLPARPPR